MLLKGCYNTIKCILYYIHKYQNEAWYIVYYNFKCIKKLHYIFAVNYRIFLPAQTTKLLHNNKNGTSYG